MLLMMHSGVFLLGLEAPEQAPAASCSAPKQEFNLMVEFRQQQQLDGRRGAAAVLQNAAYLGYTGK